MPYGRSYGGGQRSGGKGDYTSVRLTGLFETSKPGLLVGTIEGEALEGLIAKIKEASAAGKGLSVFFKEVTPPKGKYVAQIFADVDNREARGARGGTGAPAPERQQYRTPIKEDPRDSGGYNPFAPR